MDEFFARNRLSAYLDGELSPGETRDVEAALERNPALRAEFEEMRNVVALLHRRGPMTAPAGFAERLDARLAKEKMTPGWRRYVPRVRLEVAMLAAAAVVVLVVSGRKPPASPAPAEVALPAPAKVAPPVALAPPEATADPASPTAPSSAPSSADGVLGNGDLARKSKQTKTSTPSKPSSTSPKSSRGTSGVEKEPYNPEWETTEQVQEQKVAGYTAPVQYRLQATRDTSLKELQAIAAELGGRLLDGNGRPLAPYPMDEGQSRRVVLEIPQYNAAAVARKLEGLGTVEILSESGAQGAFSKDATSRISVEVAF